ncbi:UNVERIFIED_CONTAM: hypothetical protein FKN15_019957 [Acipenser sinensis]
MIHYSVTQNALQTSFSFEPPVSKHTGRMKELRRVLLYFLGSRTMLEVCLLKCCTIEKYLYPAFPCAAGGVLKAWREAEEHRVFVEKRISSKP